MPGESFRVARVADRIREEVAQVFEREVSDPRLEGLRVVRVEVSGDLQVAWVYLSLGHLDDPSNRKRAKRGLDSASGRIRKLVASRLKLRRAPELRFSFDDAMEKQRHILELLDEIDKS